jgi:hypothetical protein
MATWERIVEKARALPPERQRQILDLLDSFQGHGRKLQDPAGLLADLDIDLGDEDLAEAREELWRRFPREA